MRNDNPADPTPTDALVVHGRDVPPVIVHSWSRDGQMHSAWPGDGVEVPVDGTRISVKIINFPIGSIREIGLDTGARTHPHDSHEDVLFYQITGRRVQMCETDSAVVNPGDVSFEPHGVEHSTYQLIGGLFVEFALPAPRRTDGRAVWMASHEAHEVPCAVWVDGSAEGSDAYWAPAEAQRHVRRLFSFPGHDLIETRLPSGCGTTPRHEPHDTLFYIVSGSATAQIGDQTIETEAGDSLRAPAGAAYSFTARADAVLIQAAARPL